VVFGTGGQPTITGSDSVKVSVDAGRADQRWGLDFEGATLFKESADGAE
jgi:hypothetical protein